MKNGGRPKEVEAIEVKKLILTCMAIYITKEI